MRVGLTIVSVFSIFKENIVFFSCLSLLVFFLNKRTIWWSPFNMGVNLSVFSDFYGSIMYLSFSFLMLTPLLYLWSFLSYIVTRDSVYIGLLFSWHRNPSKTHYYSALEVVRLLQHVVPLSVVLRVMCILLCLIMYTIFFLAGIAGVYNW